MLWNSMCELYIVNVKVYEIKTFYTDCRDLPR